MEKIKEAIKTTLDFLSTLQTEEGQFPFSEGERKGRECATHWCHGAPGALPLFCEAAEFYPDRKMVYTSVAIACGQSIWKYGFLRKGFGLCHGTSGNAYFLMTLFRFTQDPLWKAKARAFLLGTLEQEAVREVQSCEYSQFKVQGVPDRPFSLMEGNAGRIVAFADFLNPDEGAVLFPAYEI